MLSTPTIIDFLPRARSRIVKPGYVVCSKNLEKISSASTLGHLV
jgi:hypothetical protein